RCLCAVAGEGRTYPAPRPAGRSSPTTRSAPPAGRSTGERTSTGRTPRPGHAATRRATSVTTPPAPTKGAKDERAENEMKARICDYKDCMDWATLQVGMWDEDTERLEVTFDACGMKHAQKMVADWTKAVSGLEEVDVS